MTKPPPWDRMLRGVVFTSRGEKPILIGRSWDTTLQPREGVLTFLTRTSARAWCEATMKKWQDNSSLRTWRVRAVRIRERVEVVR